MKILVTGVCGQLGHDVMAELHRRGHTAIGCDKNSAYSSVWAASPVCGMPYISLDITCEASVKQVVEQVKPDAVIHCAAWTAVDLAEEDAHREMVYRINAEGTRSLAMACKAVECCMIYLSTDYVFSGQGDQPWTPDSLAYAPPNVYGQSKLDGELAVSSTLEKFFIVRTAWAFGLNGGNFVKTMLKLAQKHESLRVVCDQIGTPTYTRDLARLLADMVQTDRYGYYHATNEGGYISWYEFACEIFRQAGCATKVVPVTTADYGLSKAARPFNSRLDCSKLVQAGFTPLPHWQDALKRYLKETEETSYGTD